MSSIELTKADRLTDMDTTNECQSKHNQGHPVAHDKAGGHSKRNSEYDDLEDITLTLTKVTTICEPR